jgi:hypothetical protein
MDDTTTQLQKLISYTKNLLRNPIQEIQNLPQIEWKTLIIFQFLLSLVSVVVAHLLAPFSVSFSNVLVSLFSSLLAMGLGSTFLFYYFLILYKKNLEFIKIFSLLLFAHIPFAIFHLASYFFPPADIIGLGISGILMIVGLTENFSVPKKLATQLIIVIYSLLSVFWIIQYIAFYQYSQSTDPQDLDKMEREVQDFFDK